MIRIGLSNKLLLLSSCKLESEIELIEEYQI